MNTIRKASKKSAGLTEQEAIALNEFIAGYAAKADAAKAMKIPLSTLDRIQIVKSGHPKNIRKIRKVLPQPSEAA